MELFAAIRRKAQVEELSIRQLAEKHYVHAARPEPRIYDLEADELLYTCDPQVDNKLSWH